MIRRVKGREEFGLRKLGEGRVCSSTLSYLGSERRKCVDEIDPRRKKKEERKDFLD